jgi:hypothetical protein
MLSGLTGVARTVQEWIIERRMAETRRLSTGTDIPGGEISRHVSLAEDGGPEVRETSAGHRSAVCGIRGGADRRRRVQPGEMDRRPVGGRALTQQTCGSQ